LGWLNFITILVGRFLFGVSAGVFVSICPVIIEHTVPGKYMDKGYGSSTNIAINLGVAINMSLGLLVPLKKEELEVTTLWKFIYGLPIVFLLIAFLINLLVLTNDTVKHHVEKGEMEIAHQEMKRIYPGMSENEIKNECEAMK
jgi:MFS family permease